MRVSCEHFSVDISPYLRDNTTVVVTEIVQDNRVINLDH